MKKIAGHLLRILISFAAMGCVLFFLRHKLEEAWLILQKEVSWAIFSGTVAIYFTVILLLAHRLHLIWNSQKIKVSYLKTVGISYAGLFFNFFLPSAVGGDLIKIYYASKLGHSKVTGTTTVMMDRLLGFLIVILMGVTAMAIQRGSLHDPFIYVAMAIFTIIVLGFTFLFLSRRIGDRFKFLSKLLPSERLTGVIRRFFYAFRDYRDNLPLLAYGLFLSLMIQSAIVVIYYLIAKSLQCNIQLSVFFMIVPIATIVSMIPSIGGLGVREAGSIYLLSQYVSSERALALTLLFDVLIYGFGMVGGLVFAFLGQEDHFNIKNMETIDGSQARVD